MTDASQEETGVEPIPEPEGETEIIQTDYEIGQDNITPRWVLEFDVHQPVFGVSALAIVAFTVLTLMFQNEAEPLFTGMRDWLTGNLDWFFLFAGNIFVILCLALIVSPLGKVRLGGPEATPDFGYVGWFAMLFAAGMGIGLMFFGVSEPMSHFDAAFGGTSVGEDGLRTDWAPLGGAEGNAAEAVRLGMAATIFHWGLHPWAIYAVVALALALFSYNKGLPLTLRSAFYPIFGERVWGWPGHVIDILAVLATVFGLATSLGIGAQQASAGLGFLFGLGTGNAMLIFLIFFITMIAIVSIIRGLEGGVKRLSEFNMLWRRCFWLFIILVGPDAGHPDRVLRQPWRLWAVPAGAVDALWPRGRELCARLDGVLLGLVDQLVALCRHVHRPRQPGPDGARVPDRGVDRADAVVGAVDDRDGRHGNRAGAERRLQRRAGGGAGTEAVRDADAASAYGDHFGHRDHAGGGVLRHLFRLRLAGDRHHRGRRQGQRPGDPAHLLGFVRRAGGDCPAVGRRAGRVAGDGRVHRAAVHAGAAGGLLCHREGPDGRAALNRWPGKAKGRPAGRPFRFPDGAGDEIRTHDPNLGKVMLYP
jgi:hypothetical protein